MSDTLAHRSPAAWAVLDALAVAHRNLIALFRVPTTLARHGSTLALVNGRFDLGFPPPFGPGAPAGTDFDVVQIRP